MAESETPNRKLEHLRIPLEEEVEAKGVTTLLECVHLIHNALPEINFEEIDTSTTFLEHRFSAPLLIDGMTGGIPEAEGINAVLAEAAERLKLGMVVGSQKAGLESEGAARSYIVAREKAPTVFLAANVGGAQLSEGLSVEEAERLVEMIKADALVVHLNPLQELIQAEGEPHFLGVLSKIREIVKAVKVPVMVKEVGCGLSREVALRLELAGVKAVNVAGAGGTSWAGVEQIRAARRGHRGKARLGMLYWDWGIPTAASLIEVRRAVKIPLVASGGLRSGLDVAKCLVLGGDMCGMALPLLRHATDSLDALLQFLRDVIMELKVAMFLTGSKDISMLKRVRYVTTSPLREWLQS